MGGTWGPRGPSATGAASGQVVVPCSVACFSHWQQQVFIFIFFIFIFFVFTRSTNNNLPCLSTHLAGRLHAAQRVTICMGGGHPLDAPLHDPSLVMTSHC